MVAVARALSQWESYYHIILRSPEKAANTRHLGIMVSALSF